jgi:hypothetical protein
MDIRDIEDKEDRSVDDSRKPYVKPVLTRHGDIVEQTTRGHSGSDKNRKTLGT